LTKRYGYAFDGVKFEPHLSETTLRADVVDQAHLYGLLNRLRDFGIELVSVNAAADARDAG
jgi:hypothetical protein